MMPERTGGSPSYAYPAFKDRWPRFAKHINGFTAWAYWLGWFPVAPLNMILASFYLADRFHLNTTAGFTPIHTFIAWSTLIISILGILLFFIPAYRGIRFGATFATVLALLSMIPLTFIAVAWIFNPSVVNFGELSGFPRVDGSSFFADMGGFKLVAGLYRLRLPADVERDRHGGGRLLHRRMRQSRSRRQDRDEPRRRLRRVHLHADSDRLHRRARAPRRSPIPRWPTRRRSS